MNAVKNNQLWHKDRNESEYLESISKAIEWDNLVKNAINIEDEKSKYEKIIRIDFCGIAGTTLLLLNGNELQRKVSSKFLDLFSRLDELDALKIRLKTRFLFMYLFSDFSYAQIEAEGTPHRATIENNKFDDFKELELFSLTNKEFFASQIHKNQTKALRAIQKLYNSFYLNKENKEILNLRFTCLPINFCQLTINGEVFIDPYSYAKKDDFSSLSYETPVLSINAEQHKPSFQIMEDHFRYIWSHPTTLFYEDATKAYFEKDDSNKLQQLHEIKEPNEINFEAKAKRLKERVPTISDEKLNRWKFKVERMFSNMTRMIDTSPESETVFIGFSFKNGKTLADQFQLFLEEDFETSLKVNIVNVWQGQDPLYNELTEKMKGSTLGIIIFSKDIEEANADKINYYSRPNLYFEFGYLLRHVEKFGPPLRRIMILSEEDSIIPTDFQDIARVTHKRNATIDYNNIIERILQVNKTLTERIAHSAVNKHLDRMQNAYNSKMITDSDLNGKSFNDYKNELKVGLLKIINKRFNKK